MASLKQTIEFQAKGIAKLKTQYKELEKRTRSLDKTTASAGASMAGLVGKLGITTLAIYATTRAITGVVRVGREFEKNMANVGAISGATGNELKALEKNAKDLGSSTVFTASQVSELQTEFAKLGFTSSEITGVTKDTLALASATGSDLATSASVAGQTLRAFGLDVSQTSEVTDTMASSFSQSALDMDKFANSMQYVAPIAKQVGVNVQSTTAILGTLANAGIDGSMAGTALRRIFLELSNESSKLSKRIGFPVKSTEDLQKAFKQLSKEGLTTAEMTNLVGQRAVSAFGILLDGVESTDKLTKSFNEAGGEAQRMADIQLDNLSGRVTLLGSAMEGLGITIFDRLEAPLNGAVVSMTNLVGAVNRYMEIPQSEKLEEEKTKFNNLVTILKSANTTQDTRNRAIEELQKNYPDYIGNIDLESASTNQLNNLLKMTNQQYENEIMLLAKKEVFQEQRREELALAKRIFEITKNIEEIQDRQSGRAGTQRFPSKQNLQLEELKQQYSDLILKNSEFRKSLEAEGHQFNENGEIIENYGNKASDSFKKVEDGLDATSGAGGENDEQQKKTVESQLKGVASSNDLAGASKNLARQYIVEGVFGAVKNALTEVPFPLNLVAGAVAGAGANALFNQVIKAETGYDGVVTRPTMFLAGENNRAEQVSVTPLEGANLNGVQGGGGITVNISGGVVDETFIRDQVVPAINRANQMGSPIA